MPALDNNPVLSFSGAIRVSETTGVTELALFAPTVKVERYTSIGVNHIPAGQQVQIPLGPIPAIAFLSIIADKKLSVTLVSQPGDVQLGPFSVQELLLGHSNLTLLTLQNLNDTEANAIVVFGGAEDDS